MSARLDRLRVLFAITSLGCAAAVGVGGGGAGVEVGARADASADAGHADERTCMFDRASGELRTCLHFSFGGCAMFGDRCSMDPRAPAPEHAAHPADPADPAQDDAAQPAPSR